jgi:diguanylate cyclase (GGDEF)-like protein
MTADRAERSGGIGELVERSLELLATTRPMAEILEEVLDLLLTASGADHGCIRVASVDPLDVDSVEVGICGRLGVTVDRPVEVDGLVVGSVAVDWPDPTSAPPRVTAAIEVVARIVATAWSHARDLERERVGRELEQSLIRAGQALALTIRLGDVLPVILEELGKVVPYDSASVQELRGDRVVIVGGAGINLAEYYGVGFEVENPGAPNADVIGKLAAVIVPDILGDHPYWNFPDQSHGLSGVRSWMGVPLVFGDECVGMLTLDKVDPEFYTEDHARLAQSFATQAAIALENARAFERAQHEVEVRREAEEQLRAANEVLQQRMVEIEALQEHLREQSVRDPLTGVFNRRYLMETLAREIPRARRAHAPLTVAVIDVDHFKGINDLLGHEAGDRVLAQVAEVLATHVRDEDVVCRYGGEEFVVVLPGTELEVACERAERWRADLRAMVLPHALEGRAVTISVGLASAPEHGSTGDALVRAADQAMYTAKHLGRDRIEAPRT